MLKWFPWKFILRKIARSQGFADPMRVVAKLQKFAQPAEVAAPIELLRLSSVLQIKGLVNAQAIQHNLDWIWPYWVQKQFNPRDKSFVPRAFSMTHINLTERNWTGIGLPEVNEIPIVDPAGLLMPHYDSWSIDTWVYDEKGKTLVLSKAENLQQNLDFNNGLTVETSGKNEHASLQLKAWVEIKQGTPYACLKATGKSNQKAKLVFSLRPMNPEGVSDINQVKWVAGDKKWIVNGKDSIHFLQVPEKILFSHYREGDVFLKLGNNETQESIKCGIGMATAAALFDLEPGVEKESQIEIPLRHVKEHAKDAKASDISQRLWSEPLKNLCQLTCPDPKFQFLYDAAVRSLILHSQGKDVYPGPYTYKHFWFRDAAFILDATLSIGWHKKAEEVIDSFASRQSAFGHFLSQDGEWDSNGEALWIYERYCKLTNQKPKKAWKKPIQKGARWLVDKRLSEDLKDIHAGLLPAGFSAEHLGPNDFYYWDDFWGVQGLKSASWLHQNWGDVQEAQKLQKESDSLMQCIEASLSLVQKKVGSKAMPASPYRRMDTGAIGSIAVGYPLKLWNAQDVRLSETLEYLLTHCMVNDGFFHDMSHSGINAYLTLQMAQVLLRAGDLRYFTLMSAIANLASSTGQWPEAIHPQTKGGCMGDGQHIWAAAEWILMIRNCFVIEEEDHLILCSGIPPEWLEKETPMKFGPVSTKFGSLTVEINFKENQPHVSWKGQWFDSEPKIEIKLAKAL